MEFRTPKLSQKGYMETALRSYLLQSTFNYTSYQGVSYLYTIMSALKKIYKDKPEKLKETASVSSEFHNTNPQMLPFITSIQLAMYDNGQSVMDMCSIEVALMGPLSRIGDSIVQFGIASLFSIIFAGLAMDGLGFIPMSLWFSILASMLVIKLLVGYLGFKLGTGVIETLNDRIRKVSSAANIVGVTVITVLATPSVRVSIVIRYSYYVEPGEKQVTAIRDISDKVMPEMLPIILTILVLYLIKRRNWNTHRLLILLFAIGIVAFVLGALTQQTRAIRNEISNFWKTILVSVFVTFRNE